MIERTDASDTAFTSADPSEFDQIEQRSRRQKPIGLALAAAKQIYEDFDRQIFQGMLQLLLRGDLVWLTIVLHKKVRGHCKAADGSMDDVAEIAKTIVKGVDRKGWINVASDPSSANRGTRRTDAERQDHWSWLRAFICNFVTRSDSHGSQKPLKLSL